MELEEWLTRVDDEGFVCEHDGTRITDENHPVLELCRRESWQCFAVSRDPYLGSVRGLRRTCEEATDNSNKAWSQTRRRVTGVPAEGAWGKTALDWARWREAQPNADANATALRILLEDAARVGPQEAVRICRARAKAADPVPRHYCREYCTPRMSRDYCSPWALAEQLSNFLTSDPDEDDDPSYPQSPKSKGTLGA